MTYKELLELTKIEKDSLLVMQKKTLEDKFLREVCGNELKSLPQRLANFFLYKLSDEVDSILESVSDEEEKRYLADLYMRYCDLLNGESGIEIHLDELPEEARMDET